MSLPKTEALCEYKQQYKLCLK